MYIQSSLQLAHPRAMKSEYRQELAHKVTLHGIDICTTETNNLANNYHHKNWLENGWISW